MYFWYRSKCTCGRGSENFILRLALNIKYKDIQAVLDKKHKFHISERHLKRKFHLKGHTCHKDYSK